jgi:integrase
VSDLAAAAVTLREKLAVLLTNQFGFRVVDIISMTVGRLQLCEGRLWVSGSAFPESRQGVKLNEDLARELSLLIENGNPDDWLFGSPIRSGRHLSRRAMYYLFGKLRERAGLDRKVCTLTTLRKATCASVVALDAGVKADCAGCLRLVGVNRAWLSRNSPVKTGTSPQNEAGALTA